MVALSEEQVALPAAVGRSDDAEGPAAVLAAAGCSGVAEEAAAMPVAVPGHYVAEQAAALIVAVAHSDASEQPEQRSTHYQQATKHRVSSTSALCKLMILGR